MILTRPLCCPQVDRGERPVGVDTMSESVPASWPSGSQDYILACRVTSDTGQNRPFTPNSNPLNQRLERLNMPAGPLD
jgi:hypothetical protein